MALIECAEELSVSTKAKLQDAGLLYVADVVSLLYPENKPSKPHALVGHTAASALPRECLRDEPARASRVPCDDATPAPPLVDDETASPLHEACLAGLTEEELGEVTELAVRAAAWAEARRDGSNSAPVQHSASPGPSPVSSSSFLPHSPPPSAAPRGIPGCRTLRELCAEAEARQTRADAPTHATTFSQRLDRVLGGGVPVGGVTEVAGPPGVGKTQLLLQLAVSCAMPVEFGGLGGACLFIDTEGSFVAERLEQMATAAVSLVHGILARQTQASRKRGRSPPHNYELPAPNSFTVDSVLRRVRYVRVTELAGLLAVLHSLPAWLGEEEAVQRARSCASTTATVAAPPPLPQDPHTAATREEKNCDRDSDEDGLARLRMVLIDSVALPFRFADSFEKEAVSAGVDAGVSAGADTASSAGGLLSRHGLWQRSRLVFQCSTLLEHLAGTYQLAIVATNHMITKATWDTPSSRSLGSGASTAVCGAAGGEEAAQAPSRQTVLVPALGDAWAHGLATRLLLCFHHYDVPACSFGRGPAETAACAEGVAYRLTPRPTSAAQSLSSPSPLAQPSVAQHRVGRVLKFSGLPRRETCFLLTGKGIRDVRHDMVAQRVGALAGAAAATGSEAHPPFL